MPARVWHKTGAWHVLVSRTRPRPLQELGGARCVAVDERAGSGQHSLKVCPRQPLLRVVDTGRLTQLLAAPSGEVPSPSLFHRWRQVQEGPRLAKARVCVQVRPPCSASPRCSARDRVARGPGGRWDGVKWPGRSSLACTVASGCWPGGCAEGGRTGSLPVPKHPESSRPHFFLNPRAPL